MSQQRVFHIRVKGEMGQQLREAFEDVELTVDHGVTRLRVAGSDASALHGILDRIQSFGLELIDLHAGDAGSPEVRVASASEQNRSAETSNRIDRLQT